MAVWERDWAQLTHGQKYAAEVLKFDQALWDGGAEPPLLSSTWDELTQSQRAAAELLGWDRSRWDEGEHLSRPGRVPFVRKSYSRARGASSPGCNLARMLLTIIGKKKECK